MGCAVSPFRTRVGHPGEGVGPAHGSRTLHVLPDGTYATRDLFPKVAGRGGAGTVGGGRHAHPVTSRVASPAAMPDTGGVHARIIHSHKEVIHCLTLEPALVRYGQAIAVRGADLRTESQEPAPTVRRPYDDRTGLTQE